MRKYSLITKGSYRRTSATKKRIGSLVIIGLLLSFLVWLVPQVFGMAASLVLSPVVEVKTWFFESSTSLPQYLKERQKLINEVRELKEKLSLTGGQAQSIKWLQAENEQFRSLLKNSSEDRIAAAVVGRPNTLPYDVVVIDKGSSDGIKERAPVFIGDNRVIGSVARVYPSSSVVLLATTPGFVSSVFIFGPDIYTNAVGVGGGQLRVGVPQGLELNHGDLVIFPGVGKGVYGEISHVESSPTQPEQFGFVSPEVPIQSLHFVSVASDVLPEVDFETAQKVVAELSKALFTVAIPEDVLVSLPDVSEGVATTTATTTENNSSAP